MATVKSAGRTARAAAGAFENVTVASNEAFKDQMDRGMAAVSEVSAFGKENIEAFVASATAAQKGVEALSARYVAFSRQALENHVAAAKALMTSKSVQEFVEKQSDYAKTSLEAYMAEMNEMSELFAGVAKDALKPINERMTAVGHLMQANAAVR